MKLRKQMDSYLVRNAVKDTWEKNSQLVFSGWGKCTDQDNNGIRISFLKDINKKDGAHTKGLGTDLKGKKKMNIWRQESQVFHEVGFAIAPFPWFSAMES
jgi:hypothetical protein